MCCYASCKTKEPNEDNYEWFCDYGQQKLVIVPEKGDVFQANCIYMSFYAQSLLQVDIVAHFAQNTKIKSLKRQKEEQETKKLQELQYSSQIKVQNFIDQAQENIMEESKVRRMMSNIRNHHNSLLNNNEIMKRNIEGSSQWKQRFDQQIVVASEKLNCTIQTCKARKIKMIKEQRRKFTDVAGKWDKFRIDRKAAILRFIRAKELRHKATVFLVNIGLKMILKKFYEYLKITVANRIRQMRFQWSSFKMVILFKRQLRRSLGSSKIDDRNTKRMQFSLITYQNHIDETMQTRAKDIVVEFI